jgi:phytoene dehydrogenase-like protein
MKSNYDAIIIGGGHNGLVTAASLAQAGKKVLVLEQRDVLGGIAATEEVFAGFHANSGTDAAGLFQDEIVEKFFLKMHGLEFRQSPVFVFAPQPDGRALTLWRDVERSVAEIARFSRRDADCFAAFVAHFKRMAAVVEGMMLLTPPEVMERDLGDALAWGKVALKARRLGRQEMMAFLRLLPMPVSEYLDEWFASDALKAALGAGAITATQLGPRAVGTTLLLFYHHVGGLFNDRTVLGGMGQLCASLAAVAQQKRAEISTGARVSRILIEDGRAGGVALSDGREFHAPVVVSSVDPRQTFLDLVGPQQLEPRFMRQVRNHIYRGCTARLHLALSGLPQFNGQTEEAQLSGRIRIAPNLDYLERAYDDAKYGRFSQHPYLEAVIPSITDPTLVPDGRHLLSVTMQYAPYQLRDTDWNEQRHALADRIVETLALYAPGIDALILDRHLITPLDWEQEYGLSEGHIYHGQMGLEQLLVMRPVPGWSRYRTPIANLYLCGAGAHPGGGITGAPGYNAAREILADVNKA